jgi:type I restriction enzyme S subunit
VGLEHIEPENLHIRRWGNVADGTTFTSTFKRGQVIFGKRRAYQRKVAVADFDGVCSSDIYVFESKDPNVLLPELVPFICQSEGFYDYAVKTSAGSLSPRTNWSHLANYEFPLPPVDEQRRIADLLWAADDVIQTHKELINSAENLFASKTNQIVNSASNETVPLSEIAKVIDCKHRTPKYSEQGVPIISPGNIQWGELVFDNCKRTTFEEYTDLMNHCSVEPWDLVVGRNQSFGIASYVVETEFAIGQDTVLVQATHCDKKYLYLAFQSRFVQNQIAQLSLGSTFKRINLESIRKLRFPVPDKNVQAHAAEIVDQTEELKKQLRYKEETNYNLKASLLNNLLGK